MSQASSAYSALPVWGQHAAVSLYGAYWHWLRFGPGYSRFLRGFLDRERYTDEEWTAWLRGRIGRILSVAAESVPYYRETWTASEIRAARSGILEDLPLLSKGPIRAKPRRFLRDDLRPFPRLIFHTSGSTGTPIASIWTVPEVRRSMALREARSTRWAGVSFNLPRATFSGRMVEPDPESRGPYHRFNVVEQQVYLSPFHLKRDTAAQYLDAIRRHKVQWLTGYAVSYYLLAKFAEAERLDVPHLKAVIPTSEKVTPSMRAVMERVYQCRVFEEYSTVENALFASECEMGRLHVSPDAGFVEILRPDGDPCESGEVGEVVTTCTLRDYQPLIRFRLGDMAAWDTEPCPCRRSLRVLREVTGRIEDVVVGPDGRMMVRFHGVFTDQPHIEEAQVIQEAVARIRVKVVPAPGFGPLDVADVVERVQRRLGQGVTVIVEPVDGIPRSVAGKAKAVVSLIQESAPPPEVSAVRRSDA